MENGIKIIKGFNKLKVEFLPMNLERSIEICHEYNMYAYDAYILECAETLRSDLITLDNKMKEIAEKLNIYVVEV